MGIRDLSFLSIRILSIYTFILGISHLVSFLNFSIPAYLQVIGDDTAYSEVFFLMGLPAFFLIISGIVLWCLAGKISRYLFPEHSKESVPEVQIKEIEGFVLSVAGLILVILSFSSIVRVSMNYLYSINQDIQFNRLSLLSTLAEQVIRFVIGMILLLKAEGFALILRKVRSLGLKHLKQNDVES